MDLPEPVKRQLAEAEEVARQMAVQRPEGEPSDTDAVPPSGVEEPPAREPRVPEPDVVPLPQRNDSTADEWRQRFETLQGKYNAEVPRLHQQLQQAQEFSRQLAQQLAELRSAQEELREARETPPQQSRPLISDEEREAIVDAYGDDLVSFMEKLVEARLQEAGVPDLQSRVSALAGEIEKLNGSLDSVGETQMQVAANQLVSKLRAEVEGFDDINNSPQFAEWLQQPDPLSGIIRTTIVQDAFQKLDAERLKRLFEAYKQEIGWASARQPHASAQPAATNAEAVASQVSPNTVASGASAVDISNANDRRRVWTQEEYIHVYDPRFIREVGEERALQLQAEADRAIAEGRVRLA